MLVKEILLNACEFLDDKQIPSILNKEQRSAEEEELVTKLVKYFNFIEEEIATEHNNIDTIEKLNKKNRIYFKDLNKIALKINFVKDKNGKNLAYRLFCDHVLFDGESDEISYSYIPEKFSLTDEALVLVPVRVYGYGIAREYYLYLGLFDLATKYEERFKNSLQNLKQPKKNKVIPSPNWI